MAMLLMLPNRDSDIDVRQKVFDVVSGTLGKTERGE